MKSLLESFAQSETVVIGEIAQAHDGDLWTAHAYIDAIADAGANAVKFQTHIAQAESTPREPWRVRMSTPDKTRFDYWKRMEFKESEWEELRDHCASRQIGFLSSPFSLEAVELLDRLGVEIWKLASGEVSNRPLLDGMVKTRKPIILSTGLSTWSELDEVVDRLEEAGIDLTVLQCTSEYPCPADHTGLNLLGEFRKRWGCRVGISDHSGTIFPGLGAAVLGASVIEVHVTISRDSKGVDVPSSITPDQLRELVEGVRFLDSALKSPMDKTTLSSSAIEMRRIFGRSLVARRNLEAGHRLSVNDLAYKKPGGGLTWEQIDSVVDRALSKPVSRDEAVTFEHVGKEHK